MLVPPHFLVSTAFKKMRWKDEFRKWLPKLSNDMRLHYSVFLFVWCLRCRRIIMEVYNLTVGFSPKLYC